MLIRYVILVTLSCFLSVFHSYLLFHNNSFTESYLCDVCSALLTQKFVNLLKQAQDGILDLNTTAEKLHV
jgi:hypothetical protein